ncbi:MAG: SurA N-terminal domain-containing protein [Novosphingobium sp.]
MISFIRSFFQSKLGVLISLGFIGIIALLFASGDVMNANLGGGGISGGDAAEVGGRAIGSGALSKAASGAFERAREENPRLTMERFVAAGGIEQVLDSMLDRSAIHEFGRRHGLAASDALIGSEIVKIPAFRGPDGKFSEDAYRQLLAQQGLNDQTVRDDLAQGLVARQVLIPVAFGAVVPNALAERYAALARERRRGRIALIPSALFAPATAPSDAQLGQFFAANRAAYSLPERRVIRYAAFGEEALKDRRPPTEVEIARDYAANKAQYAASETRTVTQVIVPTEAAAKALADEVRGGTALDAAARAKGLLPSQVALSREALAAQASAAVAEAVFAAPRGSLTAPARSGLGWHVARVDAIATRPARTLDQARPEIVERLTARLRRDALAELTARIEEEFDSGGNLADFARELNLTVVSSPPLTADGKVFGQPTAAPGELAPVLATAFLMERENQPQLAELEPGKRFLVFEVADLASAAPPPLSEIRARVAKDWATTQGAARARVAADKAIAALAKGATLADALRTAGAGGAQIATVDRGRQELAAAGRVPPPLALMFSMAERTAKPLAAPGRGGWFVVRLDDIEPGSLAAGDPAVAAFGRELGALSGREYAEQFRQAVRREVGVKRNAAAIRSVRDRLTGGN